MPLPSFKVFSDKVDELKSLAKALPKSVPLATKDNQIYQVIQNIPVPDRLTPLHVWHAIFLLFQPQVFLLSVHSQNPDIFAATYGVL
jgi:hypothetical protein